MNTNLVGKHAECATADGMPEARGVVVLPVDDRDSSFHRFDMFTPLQYFKFYLWMIVIPDFTGLICSNLFSTSRATRCETQ